MRKLSLMLLVAASSNVFAEGYYAGFQMGSTDTNLSSISTSSVPTDAVTVINAASGQTRTISGTNYTFSNMGVTSVSAGGVSSSTSDSSISTRFFAGYQFSEFLALEMGLMYIRDQNTSYTYKGAIGVTGTATSTAAQPMSVTFHTLDCKNTYKEKSFDMYFKGIWPFSTSFDAYGKVGGAIMNTKVTTQLTASNQTDLTIGGTTSTTPLSFSDSYSSASTKFYPAFGFGVEYHITSMIDLAGEWSRIMAESNGINNVTTLAGSIIVRI